jgi:hypothetical protein
VHSTTDRIVRAFDVTVFNNQPGEFALLQARQGMRRAEHASWQTTCCIQLRATWLTIPPSPLPCVGRLLPLTTAPAGVFRSTFTAIAALPTTALWPQRPNGTNHSSVTHVQDARAEMRFFEEPTHGALLLRAPWRLHETGLSQSLMIYHSAHAGSPSLTPQSQCDWIVLLTSAPLWCRYSECPCASAVGAKAVSRL